MEIDKEIIPKSLELIQEDFDSTIFCFTAKDFGESFGRVLMAVWFCIWYFGWFLVIRKILIEPEEFDSTFMIIISVYTAGTIFGTYQTLWVWFGQEFIEYNQKELIYRKRIFTYIREKKIPRENIKTVKQRTYIKGDDASLFWALSIEWDKSTDIITDRLNEDSTSYMGELISKWANVKFERLESK